MTINLEEKMKDRDLNNFIVEQNIIKILPSPVRLKSGKESHIYVNWRGATNDAYTLDMITDKVVGFIGSNKLTVDSIYGVPEGATKTAVLAAFKHAKKSARFGLNSHIIPMGRGKKKEHGLPEDSLFIGMPTGVTLVLEDTVTTGGSMFQTIDELLRQKIDVKYALCLTDREDLVEGNKTVAEAIAARYEGRVQYFALTRASDLIPLALKKIPHDEKLLQNIRKEFPRAF
jgi:orotate phosphoribosyltransferase